MEKYEVGSGQVVNILWERERMEHWGRVGLMESKVIWELYIFRIWAKSGIID